MIENVLAFSKNEPRPRERNAYSSPPPFFQRAQISFLSQKMSYVLKSMQKQFPDIFLFFRLKYNLYTLRGRRCMSLVISDFILLVLV